VQPDLINATTTASQPAFIFGPAQSQSSSTLFPTANHGASQPARFGLSANAESANPVFAFGGQSSSAAAAPSIFGAVTTSASVAQNSFGTTFAGLNQNNQNQNALSFGFPSPAMPSTFSFGKLMYHICHNLISGEF